MVERTTFSYTGAQQSWTMPEGVGDLKLHARGASGESVVVNDARPAVMEALTTFDPLSTFYIYVGQKATGTTATFGGGGAGGTPGGYAGGGATDWRLGGTALSNRILVAGGAGGAGARNPRANDTSPYPGSGGIRNAQDGNDGDDRAFSTTEPGGGGATISAGGSAGTHSVDGSASGSAGSLGQGGSGGTAGADVYDAGGGGGGGGYYGGGGGAGTSGTSVSDARGANGGGGSSWRDDTNYTWSSTQNYVTSVDGNGEAWVEYSKPPLAATAVAPADGASAGIVSDSNPVSFDWTHNADPGNQGADFRDNQDAYAIRRRVKSPVGDWEYWNGTTWQSSYAQVDSSTSAVDIGGDWNEAYVWEWSVGTASSNGTVVNYSTARTLNVSKVIEGSSSMGAVAGTDGVVVETHPGVHGAATLASAAALSAKYTTPHIKTFTGAASAESFTVPDDATSVIVDIRAARGQSTGLGSGGAGGLVVVRKSVIGGEVYWCSTRPRGSTSGGSGAGGSPTGSGNDGGRGGPYAWFGPTSSSYYAMAGGGGGSSTSTSADGGDGGPSGTAGGVGSGDGGDGATASAGGAGGSAVGYNSGGSGTSVQGGAGGNGNVLSNHGGGGGGGGHYGGGGGTNGSAGGGGSNFVTASVTGLVNTTGSTFQSSNPDGIVRAWFFFDDVVTGAITTGMTCAGVVKKISPPATAAAAGSTTASGIVTKYGTPEATFADAGLSATARLLVFGASSTTATGSTVAAGVRRVLGAASADVAASLTSSALVNVIADATMTSTASQSASGKQTVYATSTSTASGGIRIILENESISFATTALTASALVTSYGEFDGAATAAQSAAAFVRTFGGEQSYGASASVTAAGKQTTYSTVSLASAASLTADGFPRIVAEVDAAATTAQAAEGLVVVYGSPRQMGAVAGIQADLSPANLDVKLGVAVDGQKFGVASEVWVSGNLTKPDVLDVHNAAETTELGDAAVSSVLGEPEVEESR